MSIDRRIEDELFPFYALDALSEDERAEVEAYVAADPEARRRLDELCAAAAGLAVLHDPVQPSPAVKQRLMARIEASQTAEQSASPVLEPPPLKAPPPRPRPQASPKPPRRRFAWSPAWAFAALGLVVALAAGLVALNYSRRIDGFQAVVSDLNQRIAVYQSDLAGLAEENATLHDELAGLTEENAALLDELSGLADENAGLSAANADLEAEIAALQSSVADLETENAALRQAIDENDDVLASFLQPGALTMTIGDVSGRYPDAVASLTVNPDGETGLLLARNMAPLPPDQVYQLWLIRDGAPVGAGTFEADESGRAVLLVENVGGAFQAMGVSIEPEGGSDQPTPEQIILLGETPG